MNKFLPLNKVEGSARLFLILFVFCLSFGYAAGLYYISLSSGFTNKSVQENYLGNEADEEAEVMKFKMNEKEVLSIIHGHVISFSLIFLAIGFLLFQSSYSSKLVSVLVIEPFISIVLTFGGIWFMWKGVEWMKFIVILSGAIMHLIYITSTVLILADLLKKRK